MWMTCFQGEQNSPTPKEAHIIHTGRNQFPGAEIFLHFRLIFQRDISFSTDPFRATSHPHVADSIFFPTLKLPRYRSLT
jgi:hypothetical protein